MRLPPSLLQQLPLMSIEPEFASALQNRGIELSTDIALKLQQYVQSMWAWNEQLNLTRHTTWELFVSRDLRDCLQLAHLILDDEEVLDLGSGNGIPGIPLAILRPDIQVSLAESVAKRAGALNEIVAEIDLPVPVYAARGEDLLEDFRFTTVVSRAVGSITKFCRWIEPHWANVDRLLLIKGPKWIEERGEARHLGILKNLELRRVANYPLGAEPAGEPASESSTESPQTPADESSSPSDEASTETSDAATGVILQIWPRGRTGRFVVSD